MMISAILLRNGTRALCVRDTRSGTKSRAHWPRSLPTARRIDPRRFTRAVDLWRDLHDCEVDQLSGLFHLVISRHGEAALREMYEGWVVGAWFAQRYQRFDVSKIAWEEASWLLTYLGFEGHHGHLSGTARDGTIEVEEDADKVTISFSPCGSGGRSMAGEARDGLPPLSDPAIGWPELRDAHDFTWSESGICAYCAHCCILHENLPIAAFGYPVRVTDPAESPPDRREPVPLDCLQGPSGDPRLGLSPRRSGQAAARCPAWLRRPGRARATDRPGRWLIRSLASHPTRKSPLSVA